MSATDRIILNVLRGRLDVTDEGVEGAIGRIAPSFWGVAGNPVSHSITPRLFDIVGERLGFSDVSSFSIQAGNVTEFLRKTDQMEGDLWISCTSPLKHSLFDSLGFEEDSFIGAVNQVMRVDGTWSGTNTDGAGFIGACRHIDIDPRGHVLRIRGGGSTARSIAHAWACEGGQIIPVEGRRTLVGGPWDYAMLESGDATIGVDLDAPPAGGASVPLDAELQVSVSYGKGSGAGDFAVIMNAAQHLEAWGAFFAPGISSDIPSLSEVLRLLA